MSIILLCALSLGAAPPAQPITPAEINRLIADLDSEDFATWRKAADALWRAGPPAVPALQKLARHPDPDVQLRSRLVLSQIEWGILPDTPEPVVRAITRLREADPSQYKAAIEDLLQLGKPGYVALRHTLNRMPASPLHKVATDLIRSRAVPLARSLIAADDTEAARAVLHLAAAAGNEADQRNLAAFWAVVGQNEDDAQALARDLKTGDIKAIHLAAFYHRARGDLPSARKLIENAKPLNVPLLVGLLIELEDFHALHSLDLSASGRRPHQIIALLHLAGNHKAAESASAAIPDKNPWVRALAFLLRDQPVQALNYMIHQEGIGRVAVAEMLAVSGRYRDALALKNGHWLLAEQAVLAHRLGDKQALPLLQQSLDAALNVPNNREHHLAAPLRAGLRMDRRDATFADMGKALDRINPPHAPTQVLARLSEPHTDALLTLWNYLRQDNPRSLPSERLERLRDWFERRKADEKELQRLFETELMDGRRTAQQRAEWDHARVQLALVLGRDKQAEQILRHAVESKHLHAEQRLADFLFARNRFRESIPLYAQRAQAEPTVPLWLYLHGAALVRSGNESAGQPLIRRARLMVLADEDTAYYLAQELNQRGLHDEATIVRETSLKTGAFQSILTINSASALAARASRNQQWRKAARLYRFLFINHTGSFLDSTAYLRVPALVHRYEMLALIEEKKLDDALASAQKALAFLPEETPIVNDLLDALEKEDRKKDADRLFAPVFARLRKTTEEFPHSAECHNRLAWMCARARRHLPDAIKHARRAVELSPRAGYYDTLAESHFQNGDQKAALEAIRKAIHLAKDNPLFLAQLKRMEKGDPTAPLPTR